MWTFFSAHEGRVRHGAFCTFVLILAVSASTCLTFVVEVVTDFVADTFEHVGGGIVRQHVVAGGTG